MGKANRNQKKTAQPKKKNAQVTQKKINTAK
jgi:hypothetical protein